jgi:hypothetical protein
MAVTSEQSAPYVAPGVLVPLIERNREKGLPNPLSAEALQRLGVSDSLVPRTLQAFKALDLIGEDGRHTEILENLRRVPEAEYRPAMAQWLEAAYDHALDVIDPATADETALRDAFRNYNPISMQPRMITLFTALFEAAGVRSSDRPKAPPKKAGTISPNPRPVRPFPARAAAARAAERAPHNPAPIGLHPALAGLIASLPSPDQGWTQEARDRWYEAFGVVLNLALPPGVQRAPDTAEADDAAA